MSAWSGRSPRRMMWPTPSVTGLRPRDTGRPPTQPERPKRGTPGYHPPPALLCSVRTSPHFLLYTFSPLRESQFEDTTPLNGTQSQNFKPKIIPHPTSKPALQMLLAFFKRRKGVGNGYGNGAGGLPRGMGPGLEISHSAKFVLSSRPRNNLDGKRKLSWDKLGKRGTQNHFRLRWPRSMWPAGWTVGAP